MSQQNMKCRLSELGTGRLCVISSRLQSSGHLIQCFFPTGRPNTSPGSRFQIKSIPACWQVVIDYTVTHVTPRSRVLTRPWYSSLNQLWSYQYWMNWCPWTCLLVGVGDPVEGGGAGALRKSCSRHLLIMVIVVNIWKSWKAIDSAWQPCKLVC